MGYTIRIALFAICTLVSLAHAQDSPVIPTGHGVIDQLMNLKQAPHDSYILSEDSLGEITQYPTQVEFLGNSEEQSIFILGSLVPNPERSSFHFSIFTKDLNENAHATRVSEWSSARLLANTPDELELRKLIDDTESRIKQEIGERDIVESKLDPLQTEISQVGMVKEITDMKLQLSAMDDFMADYETLKAELDTRLNRGRSLVDPKDIDEKRKTISEHLREAAQITSVADRLNRRREDAALQNFKRKLTAVKEMKNVNMQDLAQEVLRLRRKRRELESALNLNSTDFDNAEF